MKMFPKKQEVEDVLKQKQRKLSAYNAQFNGAVSMMTSTIDSLNALDEDIQRTIGEIDAYQTELSGAKAGLIEAKSKNKRVIDNFKSLIAVD